MFFLVCGYLTYTFNSLLGFSSFESVKIGNGIIGAKEKLSIPYWDFLVLNLTLLPVLGFLTHIHLSIPYWDFLVLNRLSHLLFGLKKTFSFNSLLGFSSFESLR